MVERGNDIEHSSARRGSSQSGECSETIPEIGLDQARLSVS